MKILAFTDIHGSTKHSGYIPVMDTLKRIEHFKKEVKEKKIDVVICTGDFSIFGNHTDFLIKKLAQIHTHILLIHGNHEDADEVRILSKRYSNIHYLHEKKIKIGEYTFLGYGGDGFSRRNPEFLKSMKKLIEPEDKIVLLLHGPPQGTKVDSIPGIGHVGNVDYREFIEKHNVVLALCGHIHEAFGKEQKLGNALLMNPGPDGKIITLK